MDRFINRRGATSRYWVDNQAVFTSVVCQYWRRLWDSGQLCPLYWWTSDAGMSHDCWHDNRPWSCCTIPDWTRNHFHHCNKHLKQLSLLQLLWLLELCETFVDQIPLLSYHVTTLGNCCTQLFLFKYATGRGISVEFLFHRLGQLSLISLSESVNECVGYGWQG